MIDSTLLNIEDTLNDISEILSDKETVVVFGSSTYCITFNDIDIAVEVDDTSTLSKIVYLKDKHPKIRVSIVENLSTFHTRISWIHNKTKLFTVRSNSITTLTVSDCLPIGSEYPTGRRLIFNVNTDFKQDRIAKDLEKHIERGYFIDKITEHKWKYMNRFSINQLGATNTVPFTDSPIFAILQYAIGAPLLHTLSRTTDTILSGGFIRDLVLGTPIKDADIFFTNAQSWIDIDAALMDNAQYERIESDSVVGSIKSSKFKYKQSGIIVDLVLFSSLGDVETIPDTFDFTINMMYLRFRDGLLTCANQTTLYDIMDALIKRQLYVGDNIWFNSNPIRAVKRWHRFKTELGFTSNVYEMRNFKKYLKQTLRL